MKWRSAPTDGWRSPMRVPSDRMAAPGWPRGGGLVSGPPNRCGHRADEARRDSPFSGPWGRHILFAQRLSIVSPVGSGVSGYWCALDARSTAAGEGYDLLARPAVYDVVFRDGTLGAPEQFPPRSRSSDKSGDTRTWRAPTTKICRCCAGTAGGERHAA